MNFGELEMGSTSILVGAYAIGDIWSDRLRRSPTKRPEDIEFPFVIDDVHGAFVRAIAAGAKEFANPG